MPNRKYWRKVQLASSALIVCLASGAWGAEGPAVVKGSVKSIAQKSKTIAVTAEDKSLKVFRFGPGTAFQNAADSKEVQPGDNVAVEFTVEGADTVATRITRVIPKLPEGIVEMKLAQLEPLIAQGEAKGNYFLADARPASKYASGHLPTAHSIPLPELEKDAAKLLPADKYKLLVFYCGGVTCGLSHKSAALARKLGYGKVQVYIEGEPGWKKAEHYTIPTVEYLKTGSLVLVDLRSAKEAAKGRIPGAVNVPLAKLGKWEKKFPLSKSAQIVFYGVKEADLASAVSTARDWGYTNVTALPGGVEEWLAKGNQLEKGPGAKAIVYKKQFGPNEMGSAEFAKGLKTNAFVLVDVRTPEEFNKSHIKNALNIPTEEMAKRYQELPKDKPVVLQCNTGARAEMAFEVIKDKGLKAKYLNATVEYAENGSYQVGD